MPHKLKYIIDISLQPDTLRTSTKVALIVGFILNLINQGDAIIALDFERINIAKFIITFFVPFGVSTYSTITAKLAFKIGNASAVEASLKCVHCLTEHTHVNKSERIPLCPNCQIETNWQLISG